MVGFAHNSRATFSHSLSSVVVCVQERALQTGRIVPRALLAETIDEVPRSVRELAPLVDYHVELMNDAAAPDIEIVTPGETWETFTANWIQYVFVLYCLRKNPCMRWIDLTFALLLFPYRLQNLSICAQEPTPSPRKVQKNRRKHGVHAEVLMNIVHDFKKGTNKCLLSIPVRGKVEVQLQYPALKCALETSLA